MARLSMKAAADAFEQYQAKPHNMSAAVAATVVGIAIGKAVAGNSAPAFGFERAIGIGLKMIDDIEPIVAAGLVAEAGAAMVRACREEIASLSGAGGRSQ